MAVSCRACHFEHSPRMTCGVAARLRGAGVTSGVTNLEQIGNHDVTNNGHVTTACNQCVTKDAEIERLRNQIEEMTPKRAKRDRAEYMRNYRAKGSDAGAR